MAGTKWSGWKQSQNPKVTRVLQSHTFEFGPQTKGTAFAGNFGARYRDDSRSSNSWAGVIASADSHQVDADDFEAGSERAEGGPCTQTCQAIIRNFDTAPVDFELLEAYRDNPTAASILFGTCRIKVPDDLLTLNLVFDALGDSRTAFGPATFHDIKVVISKTLVSHGTARAMSAAFTLTSSDHVEYDITSDLSGGGLYHLYFFLDPYHFSGTDPGVGTRRRSHKSGYTLSFEST